MRSVTMTLRRRAAAFAFGLALLAGPAAAVQPDEMLADPNLEARARTLSAELRCLVCQNQSIDDSDAALAKDLRILVRERLKAGDGDGQVLDYLVARYGEFVLLRPRFNAHTAILWTLPFAVLILGAGGILVALRRRSVRSNRIEAPLSAEEKARLDEILARES
jgi:cytochrome c-type biogenesis protein CcmH